MYQYYFNRWSLPIDVVMYASAMEAMIDMPTMRPVALLIDLNMPNMDGFKFIRTLRQHKLFSTLPIIVITGLSYAQIENRGGLPRDVQIIRKPADMDCLRHFLVEILASNKIIG
jgi:CheY-like chemotaxis protein